MTNPTNYIVQYVGFATNLSEAMFLERWAPFALNFKRAGAISIDLYKTSNSGELTFISRNVWEAKAYFKNFPTGIAGSGSGGGVDVTQFGGYWIEENDLDKPDGMKLLFTNESPTATITRKRCSKSVYFENQIEFTDSNIANPHINPPGILTCIHIKTIGNKE